MLRRVLVGPGESLLGDSMELISPMEIFMSTPMEIIFKEGTKKPARWRASVFGQFYLALSHMLIDETRNAESDILATRRMQSS